VLFFLTYFSFCQKRKKPAVFFAIIKKIFTTPAHQGQTATSGSLPKPDVRLLLSLAIIF